MSDKVKPKKYEIFQPLLLAAMVIIGMLLGQKLEQSSIPEQKRRSEQIYASRSQTGLIDEAVRYIDARYIDSIGTNQLSDLAIESLIQNLDPFSVYLPAGSPTSLSIKSFEQAYGFIAKKIKNEWLVQQLVKGSTALQAGVEIGDIIVKIQGQTPTINAFSEWTGDTLYLTLVKP